MSLESEPKPENPLAALERRRDNERLLADDTERKLGSIQSAKYETVLLRLMRRTGDNSRIANSLNALIDALDGKSTFGRPDAPLAESHTKELGDFLARAAEGVAFDVQWGGRPAPHIAEEWRKSWREKYHLEGEPK